MLSIANYNMHCGMDGWGRPYDYLAAITALDADVIALEEAWTPAGDDTGGQSAEAARLLGYQIVAHTLGEGRRISPQAGAPDRWRARAMWADQNKALYMDTVRPQRPKVQATTRWKQAERGTLGIALLVRPELPIEATRLVPMSVLRADRVRRAALVADVTVDGAPISVAGTHMSHLIHGSHRNWAELRRQLRTEARPDAVLAGDMNAWGPLVQLFMPGWRRAVIGRTWPGLASAQPDRPHLGARCAASAARPGAPRFRFGPPPGAGRAGGRRLLGRHRVLGSLRSERVAVRPSTR